MDQEKNLNSLRKTVTLLIALSIIFTYFIARILYFLMEQGYIPSISLRISTIHVHHFAIGIGMLSLVGYFALLIRKKAAVYGTAILYGIGIGLTYDEALMWLRLDGTHSELVSLCTISGIALIFLVCYFFLSRK